MPYSDVARHGLAAVKRVRRKERTCCNAVVVDSEQISSGPAFAFADVVELFQEFLLPSSFTVTGFRVYGSSNSVWIVSACGPGDIAIFLDSVKR